MSHAPAHADHGHGHSHGHGAHAHSGPAHLSHAVETLIGRVREAHESHDLTHPQKISVLQAISKIASFYEKVRYIIDYREEHTIRRSAIERIMRRKFFLEGLELKATSVLRELAEGQYIANEEITEQTTQHMQVVFVHYMDLLNQLPVGPDRGLLMSIASQHIESLLSGEQFEMDCATADAMYETLRHTTTGREAASAIDTQLYCAVYRSLLRADVSMLGFVLWRHSIQQGESLIPELLRRKLRSIRIAIEDDTQWELMRRIKAETICFQIVRHLFTEKGTGAEATLRNSKALDKYVTGFVESSLESENEKIRHSGLRAVAFLILTKFVLAFAIEVPYDLFILGEILYVPLAINAIFHPLLLFLLTRNVAVPGEDNTHAIVTKVHELLEGHVSREITTDPPNALTSAAFWVGNLLIAVGVFSAILWFLQYMQFSIVGGALFIFFLTLVMYFAFRIRYRASQWRIVPDNRLLPTLFNILVTPIVRTGRYMSKTFSSINIFVLFLDFIIETPFKFLLDFSQQFLRYLSSKANDVY